jgi:concanavalin A-like lectin/glucanase superfamily protein/BACON domain-containing protein
VPVTLTVDPPPPVLSVSATTLSFSGTAGAADPAAKTFSVSNTGAGTLNWSASESASWLSVSPGSGTNAGTVTVTPAITGLTSGTYTTDITVSAPGATGSPKTVSVTLTLDPPATPPVLSSSPASLSFGGQQGGADPAGKTITVSNTGGGTLSWTASDDAPWLTLAPTSGTNNGSVTATVSLAGLTADTYTATVTISASGVSGSPRTIPVTLTVDPPPPPALAVSPTSVAFSATVGGAAPAAQNVSVTNTGSGTLSWTAADDAAWLAVAPASGTAPGTITLTPSITGLAAGTYTGTVTVTAAGATGSPKSIPVTLTVNPSTPPNLIGAWGFDEPSGTNATDASGRGHTGTISGATRTTAGRFGGALSFDGVNDIVNVADTNALDLTTGMTLEAWIQPTAVGSAWRTVLMKEQPGNLVYSLYAGNGGGGPATHVFTTGDIGINGTAATPIGSWTHLAATYDGAVLRLYVNGTQAATRNLTGALRTSTGALRIGGNTIWSEWYAGLIDEVRVYNRALTAAEIQTDMTKAVSSG